MKPSFNPEIIGELRKRVAAHNEIVAPTHPEMTMKLGAVKKLFKRWYSGPDPLAHALAMLDGKLLSMQTAALGKLEKAQEPFDEQRHPRGGSGRFRSSHQVRQVGLINRNAISEGGGGRLTANGDDALLQAAQVQVIPETRYTVFGPPIAGAVGIGLGAIGGATARPGMPWKGGGSPVDRATTNVLGRAGRGTGKLAGSVLRATAIDMPIAGARRAIPAINRTIGSVFPKPPVDAGKTVGEAIVRLAGKGGEKLGRGVGHGFSMLNVPAAAFGQSVARARGRVSGRIAAGLAGAVFPGAMAAGPLYRLQERIGPYQDARWPRRVKKMVGPLWDDPRVLAKQAELLGRPELAKAERLLASDPDLAKALGATAVTQALRFLRGPVARAYRAAPFVRRPPPARPAAAPLTPAQSVAAETVRAARPQFEVKRNRGIQARVIATHVAGLGIAGAAAGGLTGAGLASFALKHPRDPATGKFRSKGEAGKAGAIKGALIGAGTGLAFGLAAARGGQKQLLTQALERLRGQRAPGAPGKSLPTEMVDQTTAASEEAYRANFHADNFRKHKFDTLSPGQKPPTVVEIEKKIGDDAVQSWLDREGTAMAAGADVWFGKQIDDAFSASIHREFRRLTAVAADREVHLLNGTSVKLTRGRGRIADPLNDIDVSRLTPNQKAIWDSRLAMRQKSIDDVAKSFKDKAADVTVAKTKVAETQAAWRQADEAYRHIGTDWSNLTRADPSMAALRAFALRVKYRPPAGINKEKMLEELSDHMVKWDAAEILRIEKLADDIKVETAAQAAAEKIAAGFTELEPQRIVNPFMPHATGNARFFKPRLAGVDTPTGMAAIQTGIRDKAVEPFRKGLVNFQKESLDHLDSMLLAEEAALEARIPRDGLLAAAMAKMRPKLAARYTQAKKDYAEFNAAHRSQLPEGWKRDFYDFMHANNNVAAGWATMRKFAKQAHDFWNTGPGQWLLQNWKSVVTVGVAATTVGAIDLEAIQARDKKKKWVNVNPTKWHLPKDINPLVEWPNPVRRPDEAVLGITYKDKNNQDRFLSGIHVKSKDGKNYQTMPAGALVRDVMNAVRGNDQGGGRGARADVQDVEKVDAAIVRARANGDISDIGPPGFTFAQRKPSATEGNAEQESIKRWFHGKHIAGMVNRVPLHESTDSHERFYQSLFDLFESPQAAILKGEVRGELLLGSGREPRNRGVFANPNNVFQTSDKQRQANTLINQISKRGAEPTNAAEYTQMRRALWLASARLGLADNHRAAIIGKLDDTYRTKTGNEPPGSKPATSGHVNHADDIEDAISTLITDYKLHDPPAAGFGQWNTPAEFRSEMRDAYRAGREARIRLNPSADDNEQHNAGMAFVQAAVDANLRKAEEQTDLYKLFGLTKFTGRFDEQRHPRGGARNRGMFREDGQPDGGPRVGAIGGARANTPQHASPGPQTADDFAEYPPGRRERRPPESPGAAPTQTMGRQLYESARPAHMLGQIGTYGLSQAGWDAVGNITAHMSPSGGMVARATKFGLQALGGIGGAVAGSEGGAALGRKMGDRAPLPETPLGEGTARGLGGGAGQLAFSAFAAPAVRRAVAGAAGRALGGAAGGVLGPVGVVVGAALAGALTDEGVGYLYRHLSRYGAHVPDHAVKHFRPKEARA
jgi:hypothetical protein